LNQAAIDWIVGGDTGTSSMAIWAHMMGATPKRWGWSYPSDGGDFGRCARLLERVPEWKERLPEMAARSPAWAALVPHWSELTRLYEIEKTPGYPEAFRRRAPSTLYDRMKQILAECDR
jgi:hypothetical protein